MEMQILVADVGNPIEMADYAVREAVAPSTEQNGPDDHQGDVCQNGEAEGKGHMQPHAELA